MPTGCTPIETFGGEGGGCGYVGLRECNAEGEWTICAAARHAMNPMGGVNYSGGVDQVGRIHVRVTRPGHDPRAHLGVSSSCLVDGGGRFGWHWSVEHPKPRN